MELLKLTVSVLNHMKMGEVVGVPTGNDKQKLQVRRVPGGFIYEYEESYGKIIAATFVSTDELARE